MSSFIFIPGAGGAGWYWHRVTPLLQGAGHETVTVDLPGDDDQAGLPQYAQVVRDAIGARSDVVVVAQSLGGFTAPLVCDRARALVFVNAMIPLPGETPGAWWDATGAPAARVAAAEAGGYATEFDPLVYFLHDVPPAVAAAGGAHQREEADVVFGTVCDFTQWPAIPIQVVAGTGDRFFPAEFQARVAQARLGVEPDRLPGGHLIALAQPDVLANYLAVI
jgi:hypothetical protein